MSYSRFLASRIIVGVVLTAGVLCPAHDGARILAQESELDFLMMSDPAFDVPRAQTVLPEGTVRLWQETLAQSAPDLVKAAADSIAAAHSEGLPGLAVCIPELQAALTNTELHREAAYAVCRALVVLQSRESAELLFSVSNRHGTVFRQLIEPALAEWDYQPIRDEWRSRLGDHQTPRRELLLACAGVGRVKDASAVPLLAEIVRSKSGPYPADIRLAAARTAGQIAASGLELDAEQLIAKESPSLTDDLCALSLLLRHTSPAAQSQFLQFAAHANPTVAAPALRALLEMDAALVLPLAEAALRNPDPKVRQCGLDAYIALPTVERIPLIAAVMDDPHPAVRASARRALEHLGDNEMFDGLIREEGMRVIAQEGWRGQEQAALLLTSRDHKPAAGRLVELLESSRREVMVTAAWALRKLAVPETADGMLDRASRMTEHVLTTPTARRQPGSDAQLGHLFEALVVLEDSRSVPLMRRHVRKDVTRVIARSAAIWGMGRLLEGKPDDELAAALFGRLQDVSSIPPELDLVRRMCAITIGRMNAVSQLPALQNFLGPQLAAGEVDHAMAWSIKRMGGQVPPDLAPPDRVRRGWPIEPAPAREDF